MTTNSTPWQRICQTALIGTGRQAVVLPDVDEATATALLHLENQSDEAKLLAAAAILDVQQHAGYLPIKEEIKNKHTAPEEEYPYLPQAMEHRIPILFEKENHILLSEWLNHIIQAKQIIPPRYLIQFLDFGRNRTDLHTLIRHAGGQRALWLAQQNSDWRYLLQTDETQDGNHIWLEGDRQSRLNYLGHLRQHNSGAAIDLLKNTWKREAARDRSKFLGSLQINLNIDDLPFLEHALDDRSKEVRSTALDLLTQLPESGLCQRMAQRIKAHIRLTKTMLGYTLEITLPENLDDDAIRDGLARENFPSLSKKPGKRAGYLFQLIASTPLQRWHGFSNGNISLLIKMAGKTDWPDIMIAAWALAAWRQKNQAWLLALLKYAGNTAEQGSINLTYKLNNDEKERYLIAQLQKGTRANVDLAHGILNQLPGTWSKSLSVTLIKAFLLPLPQISNKPQYPLTEIIKLIATRAEPSLFPRVEAETKNILANRKHAWHNTLQQFLTTYQLRYYMIKEINA